MIAFVFALVFVTIVLAMATLGAVLVARFVFGGEEPSRRVIAAAMGGPLTVILPTLVFILVDAGAVDASGAIGFSIVLVMAFGAIGWPVSHFATRRLDLLTRFDPQVFE